MSQITSGLRSILSSPRIYELLQKLLGGVSAKKEIVQNYVRPTSDLRLLDIGCGTAEILQYLPQNIRYTGFDASTAYIATAKQRFGERGIFFHGYVSEAALKNIGKFDLAMAIGILHHLQDDEVRQLARLAYDALDANGRLLTIDPAIVSGQSRIARYLIRQDRGQNVRPAHEYQKLVAEKLTWESVVTEIRHDFLRVPYTHAIIECIKR